ncbi:MAG: AraC-like DNA-binding protein [Flavobacteriales bacterium]|jgi:AraC-like DNA-binding protein
MQKVLFNGHDLVLVITIYQSLLFAFFLISFRKGKRHSNYLLAAFLLAHAAISLDILIWFGSEFRQYSENYFPNAFFILRTAHWVEAPLLLLYVRSMVYKGPFFRRRDYLYFVPFALALGDYVINWLMWDNAQKLVYLDNYALAEEAMSSRLSYLFREAFRLYFGVLAVIELLNYQKRLKNEYADIENKDLSWLKLLSIGFLVLRVNAVFVSLALISLYEYNIPFNTEVIGLSSNYLLLFLMSTLIFFSLNFPSLFSGIEPSVRQPNDTNAQVIDPEDIERIGRYMEDEKPYLNYLLRLESLASQLDLAPRQLSQIINRHFKKSFFEFVNTYRIEESKRMLDSDKNRDLSILDIMSNAGFNSKATFNTLFKKKVGMTPSQYRKM